MSELRFDRNMSDAEGLMWRLEKDPHLSSTFGTVTLLDRAPDFDSFRRRMERAVVTIPRLRQRVMPSPANLSPPVWVDDANFDIDMHVRGIVSACPMHARGAAPRRVLHGRHDTHTYGCARHRRTPARACIHMRTAHSSAVANTKCRSAQLAVTAPATASP